MVRGPTATKCKLLAIGFKEASGAVAECPACVGVDVIGDERILLVEFIFGHLSHGLPHVKSSDEKAEFLKLAVDVIVGRVEV